MFLEPKNATHRQYEALRAYFVEEVPSREAAARFGYTPGSFRVLCADLRKDPDRAFFRDPAKGPASAPKTDVVRDTILALRKQNQSIYDIRDALAREGTTLSAAAVALTLKAEGFARLPRRRDDERPPRVHPTVAATSDARRFDLTPRRFRTDFGGLFLFLPLLARIPLDALLAKAGFPGSPMIGAGHAMRSLLGLKLYGTARHSHVMSHVLDEGLGLFAGLNVIPKRSTLTEYSCRIRPAAYPGVMRAWYDAVLDLGLGKGDSFHLDFHTIPFHGEDALVEKHYVSKRSRKQKGLLAFLAQDADERVFCYANANVRKEDQNDEILRFVDYWKERTGHAPKELIFDSKLTTYENLDRVNQAGIRFITLRRRSKQMVAALRAKPVGAWRRIELENVTREYRTPRILDGEVTLKGYTGPIRQITVEDLGHEEPTLLVTNQLKESPVKLVGRYAGRMLVENGIADGIDFFHMDALSSAVAMKVDCDLQLSLMASTLYRLLGRRVGNGYATAASRHIFQDLVHASANVEIRSDEVHVRLHRRAHNPLLLAAGFQDTRVRIPWWGNKALRLTIG
ncbi:MAG: hypothetical protein ACREA0_06285 [bacterium]